MGSSPTQAASFSFEKNCPGWCVLRYALALHPLIHGKKGLYKITNMLRVSHCYDQRPLTHTHPSLLHRCTHTHTHTHMHSSHINNTPHTDVHTYSQTSKQSLEKQFCSKIRDTCITPFIVSSAERRWGAVPHIHLLLPRFSPPPPPVCLFTTL